MSGRQQGLKICERSNNQSGSLWHCPEPLEDWTEMSSYSRRVSIKSLNFKDGIKCCRDNDCGKNLPNTRKHSQEHKEWYQGEVDLERFPNRGCAWEESPM